MTKDLNSNISLVEYNFLNLPSRIEFMDGSSTRYTYDATGRKLRAEYLKAGTQETLRTDYCGNIIYEQGRPKMLLVDGGYVTFNDNSNGNVSDSLQWHYYLKDHLGNNRVVVNENDSIEQVNHYYPYGGLMAESIGGDHQRYKYNGKELDRMHGLDWMDYGARWMNGLTFTTPDPKAWDYTDVSPYVYCMDNPVKLIDPDGRFPKMWQAKLSRWIYNTFHQTNAGPIHTNSDVKDSKYKYTYDTYSSTSDEEFVITCNYKFGTAWAQDVQNVGDGIALAGYAATLTGAGAEVGAPAAAVGNTISNVGAAAEISLDLINGDAGNSAKEVIYYLAERSIEKVIDKLMPGNAGPKAKEVVKSFKNKVIGETTGNSILGKDFDLGKSIVSQGANLKAKIVEKIIDTTLDKEKK